MGGLQVLFIGAVAVALTAALLTFHVQRERKDMDLPSYLFVKIMNTFFIPDEFPGLGQDSARLWRYRLNRTKKSGKFTSFGGSMHEVNIPMGDGELLPARVYYPTAQRDEDLPVVVWLHGGGWFTGSIIADDRLCQKLSTYAHMVVVSITYRLAPEHPYPTPVLDSEAAVRWIQENIAAYRGKSDEIYLVGESAGANLVAAVTSRNLDDSLPSHASQQLPIRGIALMYPPLASNGSFPSYSNFASTSFLTPNQIERMRVIYSAHNPAVRSEYSFAPLLTPNKILKKYPPTIMVVGKHDVLADECLVFADKLRLKDVTVISKYYTGTTHGFFGVDELPDGDKAVRFVADELATMSKKLVHNNEQ